MARIVPKQVPESLVDCEHCYETIAYQSHEVQRLWRDGFRDPVLKKSWVVCPCCGKNATIERN